MPSTATGTHCRVSEDLMHHVPHNPADVLGKSNFTRKLLSLSRVNFQSCTKGSSKFPMCMLSIPCAMLRICDCTACPIAENRLSCAPACDIALVARAQPVEGLRILVQPLSGRLRPVQRGHGPPTRTRVQRAPRRHGFAHWAGADVCLPGRDETGHASPRRTCALCPPRVRTRTQAISLFLRRCSSVCDCCSTKRPRRL